MELLRGALSVLVGVVLLASSLGAAVPLSLSYQGVLTDASGVAVSDGSYSIAFRLYDVVSGGTELWTETQMVQVHKGTFSVILGAVQPLTSLFDTQYWLGISVEGGAELSPRVQLTAAAYSLNSQAVRGAQNVFRGTGDVGIGTRNPIERLDVAGAIRLGSTAAANPGTIRWTGADFEGYDGGSWKSFTATGSGSLPGGTAGQTLRHDGGSWTANSNIYNNGTNVGIGTTNPQLKLHVNGLARFDLPTGQFNISTPGGWPGVIVYSQNGNRRDIVFDGDGLFIAAGPSSSPPSAENGIALRESGDVVIGTTSPSGSGRLEVFEADPGPGRAAIAAYSKWLNPPSVGGGYGIIGSFSSDGVSGVGIYGEAISGSPVAGNMVGVYGYTNDGYGVYSFGTLGTTGATASIVGTRDYGWREVYAMQSAGNWFEDFGSGQLAGGEAKVAIDRVFAQTVSLSDDYHVFLTPLGDCALYVAEKNDKGFVVKAVGGAAKDVAFDYRIVAKRSGYEAKRLEATESPAAMEQRLGVGPAMTTRPRK